MEGALPLQTSLSHRELSHRTPLLQERKFVSLFVTAGFCGKVFLLLGETRISCRMRLSHSFCGWEISTKRIQRTNRVRSRTVKKTPPAKSKNFPQEHPSKQSETNYRNAAAGALGGSSGRMREVWREKGHPPKGGPFSLQGLLSLTPPEPLPKEAVKL